MMYVELVVFVSVCLLIAGFIMRKWVYSEPKFRGAGAIIFLLGIAVGVSTLVICLGEKKMVMAAIVDREEMQNYIFTIDQYPYQNTKKANKMMEIYQSAMDASRSDFVYVEETLTAGWFSERASRYKKTIDAESAAYKYYGKLNKNNQPDGNGVLLATWVDDETNDDTEYLTYIYYIGGFKNGLQNGYGIEYEYDNYSGVVTLQYEGNFKDGLYSGDGIFYSGSKHAGNIADVDIELQYNEIIQSRIDAINFATDGDIYDGFFNISVDSYDEFFNMSETNKLSIYPVVLSFKAYEGDFKKGNYEGTGKEYRSYDDDANEILIYEGKFKGDSWNGKGTEYYDSGQVKYKGQFKNGQYNGKGTLYDEQGQVLHKGKFKNGDAA